MQSLYDLNYSASFEGQLRSKNLEIEKETLRGLTIPNDATRWMADMTRFNYYMTWTIKKTLPDNGPKLVGLLTKLPGTNVRSTLITVLLYISFLIDSLHLHSNQQ